MTFYASQFLRVWKPLTLGVIAIVFLAALLFTTPVTRKFDRFHCEVTIDNVSGTLTLGTFGYCLDMSNDETCSSGHNPAAGQFLSNHTIS